MRLLSLGIALGVGGALFVACGGSDFTADGDKGKGKGGTAGVADAGEAGVGNAGAGGTSGSGSSGKGGSAGTDTDPGGAGGAPPEGGTGGGGEGGEGGDTTPPECTRASDCDDARGPSACGNWACNSMGACEMRATGCTDDDGDGYGAGAQCLCAGLDCDDDDAAVHDASTESCYSGPSGTRGIGTCQAGSRVCVAGVWGPCTGEVVPSGEACNNEDDDCDTTADNGLGQLSCGLGKCRVTVAACTSGLTGVCAPNTGMATADDCSGTAGVDDDCDGGIDEDCTTGATCIRVAFTNNAAAADMVAAADPTGLTSFGSVQAAIDFADTHRSVSTRVCIAPGTACGANQQFPAPANQPILMKDGISVYGNYQSTSWGRCTNSRTRLRPESPLGVSFAFTSAANSTTVLDGVEIDRDDTPTTAGVTVDAARAVIVSNVVIENPIVATNTYGVNVVNGGQATIFRSRITGGNGSVESIGIRSVGAQVFIEDNCLSPDPTTGRCDDYCNATNPSIRSRTANGTGAAYSVFLANSPGSKIERSAMCGNDADVGAQVRITGNAAGTLLRGNIITAFGGALESYGIWLEDCGGAKPWIVDNQRIDVAGDSHNTRADAIRAVGDCHPVIDSNVLITGAGEDQAADPTAVRCTAAAGVASRCIVVDNADIRGSISGVPASATGVRCESGSCVRVANNVITGRGGREAYGVWLQSTGALVDRNVIRGGCSPTAVGIYAEDSWARVQNNRVFGYSQPDCGSGTVVAPVQSAGLRALTSTGLREIDVHSNFFDGGGPTNAGATCTSRAIALGVTAMSPATSANGVFRNNILRAGTCATRYGFEELVAAADPSVLENNDFDPAGMPTALYFDEAAMATTTPAAIDMLAGAAATRSVDPLFVAYPTDLHLQATSMCIDAGTMTGAPAWDMDNAARSGTPDIGPDER